MQGIAETQDAEARRLAINAKNKAYRDANPDRVKAWNKRYRTAPLIAPTGCTFLRLAIGETFAPCGQWKTG